MQQHVMCCAQCPLWSALLVKLGTCKAAGHESLKVAQGWPAISALGQRSQKLCWFLAQPDWGLSDSHHTCTLVSRALRVTEQAACWQGEMQEALTQVQSGMAAAEEELKKAKAQPLVTILIEPLIKEAPKPAAVPGKLKRSSLASSLFGGSKREELAEAAAAAPGTRSFRHQDEGALCCSSAKLVGAGV